MVWGNDEVKLEISDEIMKIRKFSNSRILNFYIFRNSSDVQQVTGKLLKIKRHIPQTQQGK